MSSLRALLYTFRLILDTMTSMLSWMFRVYDVPKLFYPSTAAEITIRKSHKAQDVARISLQELVEKRCPSLHDTFTPAWWLPK